MEQILAGLVSELKGKHSLFEYEQGLLTSLSQLVCEALGQLLEEIDEQLFSHFMGKSLRRDERTINCLLGPVTFKRRLVETKNGNHVYLLDEKLGIQTGRRFSPLLMARVSQLASRGTYRLTAAAVNQLTPVSMSHQLVGNIVRQTGADLNAVQEAEATYLEEEPLLKQVPVVYLEGDAFEIRIKHGQRCMVHRFQVFEGVAYRGKRHSLINRHEVTSLNRRQSVEEMEAYLETHYNLSKTLVVTGSDNGSGYEPSVFDELAAGAANHVHCLDRYHMNRKLKERLPQQPGLVRKLQEALYRGNWDQVEVILDTAESLILDDDPTIYREKLDAVKRLRSYLDRNWDYIVPYSERALCGQLSGLGSCESNHRRYTYRLKHQGRSWSLTGLKAMLRIIDAQQNQVYHQDLIASGLLDQTIKPKPMVRVSSLLKPHHSQHVGVAQGKIAMSAPSSSFIGKLSKLF